jgi:hypothetical protein
LSTKGSGKKVYNQRKASQKSELWMGLIKQIVTGDKSRKEREKIFKKS